MTGQRYSANFFSDFQPVGSVQRQERDKKKLLSKDKKKNKKTRDDRQYIATVSH